MFRTNLAAFVRALAILPVALGLADPCLGTTTFGTAAPSGEIQRLVYRVRHSTYGNIGTYTNTIAKSGDTTVVKTEGRLRVLILGIVMYRQDLSRTERWSNGRLMAFHGITKVNDRTIEVSGEADGNHFHVMSPNGEIEVPGDVRVANPWSKDVLKGDVVLTPDRGALERVSVSRADNTTVSLGSDSVPTRHFRIDRSDGRRSYEVWLDPEDTPVKFAINNPNGSVTFTLTKG